MAVSSAPGGRIPGKAQNRVGERPVTSPLLHDRPIFAGGLSMKSPSSAPSPTRPRRQRSADIPRQPHSPGAIRAPRQLAARSRIPSREINGVEACYMASIDRDATCRCRKVDGVPTPTRRSAVQNASAPRASPDDGCPNGLTVSKSSPACCGDPPDIADKTTTSDSSNSACGRPHKLMRSTAWATCSL